MFLLQYFWKIRNNQTWALFLEKRWHSNCLVVNSVTLGTNQSIFIYLFIISCRWINVLFTTLNGIFELKFFPVQLITSANDKSQNSALISTCSLICRIGLGLGRGLGLGLRLGLGRGLFSLWMGSLLGSWGLSKTENQKPVCFNDFLN